MRLTIKQLGIVAGLISICGNYAIAANGGIARNVNASYVPYWTVTQAPGVTWTFTTSSLSAGGDTVIHVQNWSDPQGGFIAGDDDGNGYPASRVVVSPTATTRTLAVFVRAYDSNSAGACTITATPSSGSGFSLTTAFGGIPQYVNNLDASGHIATVERQAGTADTLLLAVRNSDKKHAVGFDDDDGVGYMSFMHLNEACQPCQVIVGTYSNVGTMQTDLIWDEDADTTDYDSDGLGASLENSSVLGTSPTAADSDNDGLNDGDELYGKDDLSGTSVKLATWGADPLQKDVFLEIDWEECTHPTDTSLCPNGVDSGQMGAGLLDAQFKAQFIDPLKSDLAPGGFRIHLDIGRSNSDPATWYDWGRFGNDSTRLANTSPGSGNIGSTPQRAYMFHHAVSFPPEAGNSGLANFVPGPLLTTNVNDSRTLSHELGHNFGLVHGGRPSGIAINYKPNYRSLMNYAYENANYAGFSHGNAPVPTINPAAADERLGLGSAIEVERLRQLQGVWCPISPYDDGKCVNIDGNAGPGIPIGAVDWNHDGVYATSGTVQGLVAVGSGYMGRSPFPSNANYFADTAMSWVNVGGTIGNQLWMIGRNGAGQLAYARLPKANLDAGCGSFNYFDEDGPNDCAGLLDTTTIVPGPITVSVAPGVAEYNNNILVVYQKTTGTISSRLVTINNMTSAVSFGSEVTLPGGYAAAQDITAIATAVGEVTVYIPVNTATGRKLMQWTYNGSWSSGSIQQWSDGTDINPIWGIGATVGYQDGSSTPSTYAAIPSNPDGLTEFARRSNASPYRWSKVTFTCAAGTFGCVGGVASSWAGTGGAGRATDSPAGTQPLAYGRPGLAYQRRAGQANSVGRFYMAINQGSSCSGPFGKAPPGWCDSVLIMTEGNLATGTPTSQRLTWITPMAGVVGGNQTATGISLLDDLVRDSNLRAFSTSPPDANNVRAGLFLPLADGIINAPLRDVDDYPYLQGGLRAALCLEGGVWPGPCSLPSYLP